MTTAAAAAVEERLLLRHDDDGIVTLTLNRPRQFNALSRELLSELQAALDAVGDDDTARVVIVAGNGRAFCAGHDLKEMRAHPDQAYHKALFEQCSRVMLTINHMPQPVIAKVHGIATAAGCQLVAACDLAVAADTASFATSGINVGLFCSTPGVALSRNLSRKQAFELLFTGDFIDAKSALQQGLVNRVVTPADLDAETHRLATAIGSKSPLAVRMGKAMFYRQLEMNLAEAYDYASEIMACNMVSDDACEGIDAFIEKRKPQWRGC